MSIFDKLKGILNIEFKLCDKLVLHVNSNNVSKKIEYKEEDKILDINLQGLDSGEKEKVKQVVNSAVNDEDYLLLEDESKKVIDDFKVKDKKSKNQEILNYLKDKIPTEDYIALRASLYLREKFREGADITYLKKDIMAKYGDRGKKISNLCTAGYFEDWIIPIHQIISHQPDFSEDAFSKTYNLYIEEAAFSVFVYKKMSEKEVKEAILKRIDANEKYKIKFINIHGIGKSNIEKIKKTIAELESKRSFKKTIEEKNNSIMVRLDF